MTDSKTRAFRPVHFRTHFTSCSKNSFLIFSPLGATRVRCFRATDAELRSLTRERLEEIMKAFREILKRAHRSSDAFEIVERLQLDLALKLYRYVHRSKLRSNCKGTTVVHIWTGKFLNECTSTIANTVKQLSHTQGTYLLIDSGRKESLGNSLSTKYDLECYRRDSYRFQGPCRGFDFEVRFQE